MTWVHFNLGSDPDDPIDPDLPIEVRDASMTLVRETTARDSVELQPGDYLITARLPGGQKVSKLVDLKDSDRVVCDLTPDAAVPPPPSPAPSQYVKGSLPLEVAAARDEAGARDLQPLPPARLRIFTGNVIDGIVQETTPSLDVVKRSEGVVRLSIGPGDTPRFVQVLQVGRMPVVVAVPTSVNSGCSVVIYRQPTRYWVELYPEDYEAGVLFRYRKNNMAQQQAAVAETLLRRKMEDAIAAAVGGYALLRFGDLERLHDWTENLSSRFPSLPDGAAIYAEHLARLGRHAEALKTFALIPERGLPIFSDGIRLLFERMKLYADSEFAADAKSVTERFTPYIRAVDFDKALTTFAGNPGQPDDTRRIRVSEIPPTGIDIGSWFA